MSFLTPLPPCVYIQQYLQCKKGLSTLVPLPHSPALQRVNHHLTILTPSFLPVATSPQKKHSFNLKCHWSQSLVKPLRQQLKTSRSRKKVGRFIFETWAPLDKTETWYTSSSHSNKDLIRGDHLLFFPSLPYAAHVALRKLYQYFLGIVV